MKLVKQRKDEISQTSERGVENWMRGLENAVVIQGHATFENHSTVRIGADLLHAKNIFINVGARAAVPPIPGIEEVPFLTNSSIMAVDFLPEHLLIIGGSYIGLEFAQMYRRFGSRVTIVEKGPRLIAREDVDVSITVQRILEEEGIDVRLNAECISARKVSASEIEVGLDCKEPRRTVRGTHLLLGVGRTPNTADLELAKAGVKQDARGYVVVDDELRTNVPGIYALGDCNGRGAFTHTSYNDHEIVADNLLSGAARRVTDRITTYALFIDPPLGRVGMTESEVKSSRRKALIGVRPMSRVGRAVEKGETHGFMKVIVDAENKQLLGAAILGPGGDEAIHCLTDVMYAKAPYTLLTQAVHIHPTVSELIPTVLGEMISFD